MFAGFGLSTNGMWYRTYLSPLAELMEIGTDVGDASEYDADGNPRPCTGLSSCFTNPMPPGTPFTVTATDTTAIEGRVQRFRGWTGIGVSECPMVRTCTFEMRNFDSFTPIGAVANARSRLTLTTTGQGHVDVYNDIGRLDRVTDTCSGTCEIWMLTHHGPKLTAVAAPGWRVAGWDDGDCRASIGDTCGLEFMTEPRAAHVTPRPRPVRRRS